MAVSGGGEQDIGAAPAVRGAGAPPSAAERGDAGANWRASPFQWLVFIGWFINAAAIQAHQQTRLARVLEGITVAQAPGQRCLPVVASGNFAAIMTPLTELVFTTPSENIRDALRKLMSGDVDQLPVVDDGRVRAILRRADVIRWLELQQAASSEEGAAKLRRAATTSA